MQFEQVYQRLLDNQRSAIGSYVVLWESSLRHIYQHIVANRAKDCLELGTAFGATACVMAAAVEEIGGGMVTTVDLVARTPIGVAELAQVTGLGRYVRAVTLKAGYNWFLLNILREQVRGRVCEPCYDFCFLDGAHLWEPDVAASYMVTKLLRPGGWLMMDDLHWKPRIHPGWETAFAHMSDDELDTRHIGMVFDLLVKTNPELDLFILAASGHQGWARKAGPSPMNWLPRGVIAGPLTGSRHWQCDGVAATANLPLAAGMTIEPREGGALIRSTINDPSVRLNLPTGPPQPIDYVTVRLNLIAPDQDFVQLYWIGADYPFFNEARSMRCIMRALRTPQDLTFPLSGTDPERTIGMLRLDPGDGPCEVLLESVTVGRW